MNTYIVNGRVARAPKLEKTSSGVSRLTLTLLSHTHVKEGEHYLTHSVQVVFYGGSAEFLSQRVTKGSPLHVSGEMAHRVYENDQGERCYWEFLRGHSFELLESQEMTLLRQSHVDHCQEEEGREEEWADGAETQDAQE